MEPAVSAPSRQKPQAAANLYRITIDRENFEVPCTTCTVMHAVNPRSTLAIAYGQFFMEAPYYPPVYSSLKRGTMVRAMTSGHEYGWCRNNNRAPHSTARQLVVLNRDHPSLARMVEIGTQSQTWSHILCRVRRTRTN